MPSRPYREREDDGWVRPYDPYRDVGEWSRRPHSGEYNYGFDTEQEYVDPYQRNRPYYIYGKQDGRPTRTRSRSSSSPSRHVPIQRAQQKRCIYLSLTIFSILALILLVALVVFLVLFVLGLQNNSTTAAPTQPPGVATQGPVTGFVEVDVSMSLTLPFLPEYNNAQSPEYKELESNFINSMDAIFMNSDLRESYEATRVNRFSSGSVNVDATFLFSEAVIVDVQTPTADPTDGTSTESQIGMKVETTIKGAVEDGTCCQDLEINSSTVESTQVTIRVVTTSVPTVQPTTQSQSTSTPRPPTTTLATTAAPEPRITTEAMRDASTTPVPNPPTTARQMPVDPTTPVASTTEAADPTTAMAATPAMTTTVAEPVTTTPTEPTTSVAATTEDEGPATTMMATPLMTTTVADPVTTPREVMTSTPTVPAATTEIVTTTSSQATTPETTTAQQGTLNPPECGVSTQPPPSTQDSPVTARGTWPWLGSLRLRTGHSCGVTLLNHLWALTSASCVGGGATYTSLVFGDTTSSYSQSNMHIERAIARVYSHPGFNPVTFDNNIAFIQMAQPVDYSSDVGPVCLRDDRFGVSQNYSNCYTAGWSTVQEPEDALQTTKLEDALQTASVSDVSDSNCQFSVPVDLTDKFICAQFPNADACIGDAGAGLVCQDSTTGVWNLVGIMEYTLGNYTMGLFTKVSSHWDVASSIIDGVGEIPCETIQVPQCISALPYSSTYPTTQSAVTDIMNLAEASSSWNCHNQVSEVLCATIIPECRSNSTGLTLCRQTCEDVISSCSSLFQELFLTVDCRLYPMDLTSSTGLCEAGEDNSCGNSSISLQSLFDYTIISSPNFPNTYPGEDDCVWLITAPQDAYVVVKFLSLEIEACCDTLTIGEGTDVNNRTTIHHLVYGNSPPLPLVIPSSVVWLRFQSDYDTQQRGFQVEVQAVGKTGLASICSESSIYTCTDGISCIPFRWRCDEVYDCVIRDDESCRVIYQEITLDIDGFQQIKSPGYDNMGYERSALYTYIIIAAPGRKIIVNFNGFDTEAGYDFLEVGDSRNPANRSTLFFFWSGTALPPALLSDGNEMWIQFRSDGLINGRGFDLYVFDYDGSVTFTCESDEFECGHSVCLPGILQCDGEIQCADGSDEAGCVSLTASGSMTLLTPFSADLANETSMEYLVLSQQFIIAMGAALANGLGAEYIYTATTVNSFRSEDDPVMTRAANTPNTVVDFTIELTNLPMANPTNVTRQIILDVLLNDVADGSLGSIAVNESSVQIYEVSDGTTEATTEVYTTGPSVCAPGEFECDGGQCIPQSSVCDQISDCTNGTDEVVGPSCDFACGPSDIILPPQGSVSLVAPTFTPNHLQYVEQRCGYRVIAPTNHRVYLRIHSISVVFRDQDVLLALGQGETIFYTESVMRPLDFLSTGQILQIALAGIFWTEDTGINFEFWATNDTDIPTCNNGIQVLLPANKRCNQYHDCNDYTDETNCDTECGQSNYTLEYSNTTILQLTNYPVNYFDNMACLWLITGLPDASIVFQTIIIDLIPPDSLSFGRGHNPLEATAAVMPGILPTGSHVLVADSRAWVLFVSDSASTSTGFVVSMRVLYDTDYFRCNNLVQVVFQEDVCDGIAQCEGDPTDESNCDACRDIPIATCSNLLPYSRTRFPNMHASDVASAMAQYSQAQDNLCQSQTQLVLCSLLFPECPEAGSIRRAVCRSVCEAAVSGCNLNNGICDSLPETGGDMWCNYEDDIIETGICGTRPAAPNPFSRIVNGEDALLGEWPWMVLILDDNYNFQCGATLISPQWAITAAHCEDVTGSALMGFINRDSLGPHYQLRAVTQFVRHPFFDRAVFDNDIALIKLESPVEFNDYIRPACINTEQNETEIYQNCYGTGWGGTSEGGPTARILQEASLPLIPLDNCTESYNNDLTENMICAGYLDGLRDACQGDSGGPLICEGDDGRWRLVGATSFGNGCARPNFPGIYARISRYIDFIQFHVTQDAPAPEPVIGN